MSKKECILKKDDKNPVFGTEKVAVLWFQGKLLELPVKNRLFGVCGKTNRIFRIAQTPYDAITIVDILIEKFQCEEKDRCLNVKCPLNKSTARSLHVYRKDFAKLPIEDQYPGLAEKLEQSFKDHPKGGFIIGAMSKDQPFEWPPPIRD